MATLKAGYDLLSVLSGTTSIDLDPIFPGVGVIRSDGVPLDRQNLGTFTTGFIRKADLPDGQSGVVPIVWFAEHSMSVTPIELAPFGLGPGKCDFHTIINLGGAFSHLPNTDGLVRPSDGVLVIRRLRPSGGTFEIVANINPLIVLTRVGGSVVDLNGPDVLKVLDGSGLLNPVTSIGGQWSEAPHGTQAISSSEFSTGGDFFAALDRATALPAPTQLLSGGVEANRQIEGAITF